MKIISYSDLHLESGIIIRPPRESDADLMILAGDIITFRDFTPLEHFLRSWDKPVLYVAGNHEYYTHEPMQKGSDEFKQWLSKRFPKVTLLQDEAISIGGVEFFGGSMWTDFAGANPLAMVTAQQQLNDYRYIMTAPGRLLRPGNTVDFHASFLEKLLTWFETDISGARIVITHHAPAINPRTQYRYTSLMPAFNSLDMPPIIEKYQPRLWVYGHTHECDDQMISNTRIISNQRGYPKGSSGECEGFDSAGLMVEVQ